MELIDSANPENSFGLGQLPSFQTSWDVCYIMVKCIRLCSQYSNVIFFLNASVKVIEKEGNSIGK